MTRMLKDMVPTSNNKDLQHFLAMMDINNDKVVSMLEFISTLEENRGVHAK